jgi:hypothetical protein
MSWETVLFPKGNDGLPICLGASDRRDSVLLLGSFHAQEESCSQSESISTRQQVVQDVMWKQDEREKRLCLVNQL